MTRFAYDGSNVWADLNSSNALTMRRLYLDGVDQPFARVDSSNVAAWYLADHLGSVRDVMDKAAHWQRNMPSDFRVRTDITQKCWHGSFPLRVSGLVNLSIGQIWLKSSPLSAELRLA